MMPNPVQPHLSGIVDVLIPVTGAQRERVPCASVSPAPQTVPRILSLSQVLIPGYLTMLRPCDPAYYTFCNTYHYTFVYFISLTHKVLCLC